MRINPFQPNSPVTPYSFHGRIPELENIHKILFQGKNGSPSYFLLTGERGIGKSSLLVHTNYLAAGKFEGDAFKYLVVQINLDRNTSLFQLAKKIHTEINRSIQESHPLKKALGATWDFVKQLEVQGIKYNEKSIPNEDLIDKIIYSLVDTTRALVNNGYDGILILIDEADNGVKAELGIFLKNLSEKLLIERCQNVIVGLAGLPKIISTLRGDHPSSLRLFEVINVGVLKKEDVFSVMDSALKVASKKNAEKFSITKEAKDVIALYSEGYPHFVQQIGASCFDLLSSDEAEITEKIATDAMFRDGGAFEKIGLRYYHDMYWLQIQEEKYREVLQIMADLGYDRWVKKSDIAKKFTGSGSVLANALSSLTERGIIMKDDSKRGLYRLQWLGFALWIKYCGNKK